MSQFDPSDFKSVTLSKAFNAFNILLSSESTSAPGDSGGDEVVKFLLVDLHLQKFPNAQEHTICTEVSTG